MSRTAPARVLDEITVDVGPYSERAEQTIAFRNAERRVERGPEYFRWRYVDRPSAAGAIVAFARDRDGILLGAASMIPRDFVINGARVPVGLVGDIAVAVAARGRGVATELLSALRNCDAARALRASIVLPNSDVIPALLRAGWTPRTELARYVRVLDATPRLRERFGRFGAAVAQSARPWLVRDVGPSAPVAGVADETTGFPDAIEGLWLRASSAARVLSVRDRANLEWRFARYPGGAYRNFSVFEGAALRAHATFRAEGTRACIDDYLAEDPAAADALAAHFVRWACRTDEFSELQVRATPPHGEIWRRRGFSRRADVQHVFAESSHEALPDGKVWFMTASDKDA